jgi:hypothetical protein
MQDPEHPESSIPVSHLQDEVSLIFREFTGNLVKFGAIAELLEGFFFLGVFLALDIVSVSLYVAAFFCFGVYGSQML